MQLYTEQLMYYLVISFLKWNKKNQKPLTKSDPKEWFFLWNDSKHIFNP